MLDRPRHWKWSKSSEGDFLQRATMSQAASFQTQVKILAFAFLSWLVTTARMQESKFRIFRGGLSRDVMVTRPAGRSRGPVIIRSWRVTSTALRLQAALASQSHTACTDAVQELEVEVWEDSHRAQEDGDFAVVYRLCAGCLVASKSQPDLQSGGKLRKCPSWTNDHSALCKPIAYTGLQLGSSTLSTVYVGRWSPCSAALATCTYY